MTRLQRRLVYVVATGAVLLAGVGFVGSYAAVRKLAEEKHFGTFALVFPLGLDAGIVVLLALDLLLAWVRMPFPLLRQTAWLLTAATIAFNAAAAWPDPIGTGMHAVIPILFIIVTEAARNAVGRIADITADKHMDSVRLSRWLLAPAPTFKLWRRMKLWELRNYEQVIQLEQDRLIYRARLQADHGRLWRWKAPVEDRLQLRLVRYGRPLPAAVLQPDAPAPVQLDIDTAFDAAADEAVALAPPAAPALALEAAPAAAPEAQPDAVAAAPAAEVQLTARPAPTNEVPAGTRLLPVICRPPALGSTGLYLDLVPMPSALREVTADAQPPTHPQSEPRPQPRLRTEPPAAQRPDDEALIAQAVTIACTRTLSLRVLQTELHIGQRRAQRILAAAEDRIRAAVPAAAPEERSRPALASTG
ncbi:DUF2637 domain-containing protein [Streptomyces sp. NBC_00842]|uniref:DUF2637 domain-containing protein n=1 Tax=Streptomyces sp. NBC_00842 TaxID=2975848 RepID=UPI00386D7BDC|nr:DUF2637 domain-containing protein [Streptomyces sp. NBC_00842]